MWISTKNPCDKALFFPITGMIVLSVLLAGCGQTVTLYKSRHPADRSIHDAWVKYNKETINPYCRDDYIRGKVMGLHAEPLAQVLVEAGNMKTRTDTTGEFYLIIPDGMNLRQKARFQYRGYRNIEVPLEKITCREIIVRMQETVRSDELND